MHVTDILHRACVFAADGVMPNIKFLVLTVAAKLKYSVTNFPVLYIFNVPPFARKIPIPENGIRIGKKIVFVQMASSDK